MNMIASDKRNQRKEVTNGSGAVAEGTTSGLNEDDTEYRSAAPRPGRLRRVVGEQEGNWIDAP